MKQLCHRIPRKLCHYTSFLVVCTLILVGCCKDRPLDLEKPDLPTHVSSTSDSARLRQEQRLMLHGAQVITIGQDYLISIPSILLFTPHSPRLTRESYALLNDVACYLKQFREVSIYVDATTVKHLSAKRDYALTLTRARAVGEYLWAQGVDSRLIFTRGLGSDKPIISVRNKGDAQHNARVDITFRNVIV